LDRLQDIFDNITNYIRFWSGSAHLWQ
jgi:hypothetical protein